MNWRICKNCKGNGTVDGWTVGIPYTIPDLDERGWMFRNRCDVCTGTGKVIEQITRKEQNK